jgi:hypothetical protein
MSDLEREKGRPKVKLGIGLRNPAGPPSQPSPAGDEALNAAEEAGIVVGIREPGQPTQYRPINPVNTDKYPPLDKTDEER